MTNKLPEALRLAAAISGWYAPAHASSADCDKAAALLLLTQHALLERALSVLGSARKVAYMGGAGTCDEMAAIDTTLADLTAHLETK